MDRRHRSLLPDQVTRRVAAVVLLSMLTASSCGDSGNEDGGSDGDVSSGTTASATTENSQTGSDAPSEDFPDVLDVQSDQAEDGSWTFSVTLSSPYDTPEHYADAWRVAGPDGTELGFRLLTHDHANEQPFTRSQSGIVIPEGVETVTVEGRDRINGWGGDTIEHDLSE